MTSAVSGNLRCVVIRPRSWPGLNEQYIFGKKNTEKRKWVTLWFSFYLQESTEPDQASIYRSLVTNTSKEIMCFSDFPMPAEYPNYLHNSELLQYFRLYADHFHLHRHIRFQVSFHTHYGHRLQHWHNVTFTLKIYFRPEWRESHKGRISLLPVSGTLWPWTRTDGRRGTSLMQCWCVRASTSFHRCPCRTSQVRLQSSNVAHFGQQVSTGYKHHVFFFRTRYIYWHVHSQQGLQRWDGL